MQMQKKCFGKLWLRDSLIETERIGYNKKDKKMLCEISKTTEIVVDTVIGIIDSIKITEVAEQASIFEPTMNCATTAKINVAEEKIDYKYCEIEIGMSVYMDDISLVGEPEEINKRRRKCARMEAEKKMKYSLSKTKYMVVKTGKERKKIFQNK